MMKIFTYIFCMVAFLAINMLSFAATYTKTVNGQSFSPQTQTVNSGVKELKNVATLNAFPNPTRGETTITLNHASGENYKIRISNAIGRVVKTIDMPKQTADAKVEVDLGSMPSGFYFYSLLANDKMIETKRLILQH